MPKSYFTHICDNFTRRIISFDRGYHYAIIKGIIYYSHFLFNAHNMRLIRGFMTFIGTAMNNKGVDLGSK